MSFVPPVAGYECGGEAGRGASGLILGRFVGRVLETNHLALGCWMDQVPALTLDPVLLSVWTPEVCVTCG